MEQSQHDAYSQILKGLDSALVELEQLAQETCRQLVTYYAIVAGESALQLWKSSWNSLS